MAVNEFDSTVGLTVIAAGKRFNKKSVVHNINLHIQRGEAVGLLGPNGAGKTTTFSVISGLLQPTTGKVYLDNIEITNLPMYQRARMGIGYLPQEPSIFRGMTVEDNIRSVLELYHIEKEDQDKRLDALLGDFMITHLRQNHALTLSGGERRRVEIARALASDPNFILLDEPLAGIDPIAVADIRDLIGHLKDRDIGVLITDHNVRETLGIVDRAYIIADGRVLMEGTPRQIIKDKKVKSIYLGDAFEKSDLSS